MLRHLYLQMRLHLAHFPELVVPEHALKGFDRILLKQKVRRVIAQLPYIILRNIVNEIFILLNKWIQDLADILRLLIDIFNSKVGQVELSSYTRGEAFSCEQCHFCPESESAVNELAGFVDFF